MHINNFSWFPMYPGDYLSKTHSLTTEEHGAYLLLLMHLYSSDGTLEFSPKMICKLTGLSRYKLPKFMPVFNRYFENNGKIFWSDRVLEQIEATNSKNEKNSQKASIAARKRWGLDPGTGKKKK